MSFKLSRSFMSRIVKFSISPSWVFGGWWAIRRDCVSSPDFSKVEGENRRFVKNEEVYRFGVDNNVNCEIKEDVDFEKLLTSSGQVDTFVVTSWIMAEGFFPKAHIDGVLFESKETGKVVFVDRGLVEAFDIETLQSTDGNGLVDPDKRFVVAKRNGYFPRVAILDGNLFDLDDVENAIVAIASTERYKLGPDDAKNLGDEVRRFFEMTLKP